MGHWMDLAFTDVGGMMDLNKKEEEFLKEYEKVCKKHQFIINSCECCESPWIISLDKLEYNYSETLKQHIEHLKGDRSRFDRSE